MAKSLLDTDILSEVMRGKNERVVVNAATYVQTNRLSPAISAPFP